VTISNFNFTILLVNLIVNMAMEYSDKMHVLTIYYKEKVIPLKQEGKFCVTLSIVL